MAQNKQPSPNWKNRTYLAMIASDQDQSHADKKKKKNLVATSPGSGLHL